MGAEYINSPENNNEDYPNENLHLYESNPFANPDTNLERDNLPDEDLYERAIFNQNQLEEKSNESSIIKEQKDTKESTNNQITPVVSEKDSNKKVSNIFLVENKKLLGNKTGRKPKDENKNKKQNNKQFSRKYDMDDIMIKNQVSFINYCTDFTNCVLKKFEINDKFLPIDHKIKKLATFDNFYSLKQKTIGDIIKLKRSEKYKNAEIKHNVNLYDKIVKNFPVIKNLFSENYITFFQKYYYKGEKIISLKDYGCNDFLTLSDGIISHQDKIRSFKEPKYVETYENYVRDLYFKNKINFHATK
jgi:hypothetical protein